MKFAIIGHQSPLAISFLKLLNSVEDEHEYAFYEKGKLLPIVEFRSHEMAVRSLDEEDLSELDADLLIFFPSVADRELMLRAEEAGKRVLDLVGVFADENTVPLIVPGVKPSKFKHASIVSVADVHLFILAQLLRTMEDRFHLKRASMTINTPEELQFVEDDYTDREIDLINQGLKILDDKQTRLTVSFTQNRADEITRFFLNVEFVRPLNTDTLKKQIQDIPMFTYVREEAEEDDSRVLIARTRRDLSVDSGLHMTVEARNLPNIYAQGLRDLLTIIAQQE